MFYLTHDVPNRFLPARSNALEKLSVCLTSRYEYLQRRCLGDVNGERRNVVVRGSTVRAGDGQFRTINRFHDSAPRSFLWQISALDVETLSRTDSRRLHIRTLNHSATSYRADSSPALTLLVVKDGCHESDDENDDDGDSVLHCENS